MSEEPRLKSDLISLPIGSLDSAVDLLTRAFFQDPLMIFDLPNSTQRKAILSGMMRTCLRYCLVKGEVSVTPEMEAVGCWIPPCRNGLNPLDWIRAGWNAFNRFPSLPSLGKILSIERKVDQVHHQLISHPHWYLMLLAVDPDHQGKGFGKRMLDWPGEARSFASAPVYLETMNPQNVSFYQKQGFSLVHEEKLTEPNLWFWGFLKENN